MLAAGSGELDLGTAEGSSTWAKLVCLAASIKHAMLADFSVPGFCKISLLAPAAAAGRSGSSVEDCSAREPNGVGAAAAVPAGRPEVEATLSAWLGFADFPGSVVDIT